MTNTPPHLSLAGMASLPAGAPYLQAKCNAMKSLLSAFLCKQRRKHVVQA